LIIKDDLLITSDSKIFQQVVLKILLKKKVFLRFSVLTSNVSDILCLLAGIDITSFYGFDLELFRQSGILCFSCYSNVTLQWLTSFWSGLTIKSILNDIGFSYIWNIQQNDVNKNMLSSSSKNNFMIYIKCQERIILTFEIKNLYFNRICFIVEIVYPLFLPIVILLPNEFLIFKRYTLNGPHCQCLGICEGMK
jgi:hypothetical protein